MSLNLNQVSLAGRLVAEPEMRTTASGTSVTTFRIAINRKMTEDTTDFIPVVCWNKTAEFVDKYFTKGQAIFVSGELHSRQYEDKDENKRTAYNVNAYQVDFVESKNASNANKSKEENQPFGDEFGVIPGDEELPF